MRATIDVDGDLLKQVEQIAAREGKTLAAVIEEALRGMLGGQGPWGRERIDLPTFRGNGLQPGVDLDNSARLLDLMERSDAAD